MMCSSSSGSYFFCNGTEQTFGIIEVSNGVVDCGSDMSKTHSEETDVSLSISILV